MLRAMANIKKTDLKTDLKADVTIDSIKRSFRGQLELPIQREVVKDRNADKGGRSFYFFDFDDNVAFLSTAAFVFHKETGAELKLTSAEWVQVHREVGKSGPYADYTIDLCNINGTFRSFRDQDQAVLEQLIMKRQMFIEDLACALGYPDFQWKGPSWSCFYHATLNQRPVSVITARGHSRETIREGVRLMVDAQHLPHEPNYLSIYPVTNPLVRAELGDFSPETSVADLKRAAIRASVERAVEVYGHSPHHRFGMSDDDPHNIELIVKEMSELKKRFPEMSFFVIETQQGRFVKWEVFEDRTEATLCARNQEIEILEQLTLLPQY